jgi:cytochrome c oxidase cbb3-type subunit 1
MDTDLTVGRGLGRLVARHSLGWLVAANLVGLWLAALLVWPALGDLVAPLSYGRWIPLHLDWELYGWCSLPLVGSLMAWCLDRRHPAVLVHARVALVAWSLALALGGIAWLGGVTSGKLFLEWHGWARPVLPVAMLVLWVILGAHTWWRWPGLAAGGRLGRVALLAPLVLVPSLLYWASDRRGYAAVNPDSGGATGASLLGSTLVIITLFLLLPVLLGVRRQRSTGAAWPALGLSWAVFALLDHGNTSHHDAAQIAGLGLLLFWVLALAWYWRSFTWQAAAAPWRTAALVWWAALVVNGWISFLPGVSEKLKFTDGLVAHSHLAMAGLATCSGGLILAELTARAVSRPAFVAWQAGCALQIVALLFLGWAEAVDPGASYRGEAWPQSLLAFRLAAGAVMTLASVRWWWDFSRS